MYLVIYCSILGSKEGIYGAPIPIGLIEGHVPQKKRIANQPHECRIHRKRARNLSPYPHSETNFVFLSLDLDNKESVPSPSNVQIIFAGFIFYSSGWRIVMYGCLIIKPQVSYLALTVEHTPSNEASALAFMIFTIVSKEWAYADLPAGVSLPKKPQTSWTIRQGVPIFHHVQP